MEHTPAIISALLDGISFLLVTSEMARFGHRLASFLGKITVVVATWFIVGTYGFVYMLIVAIVILPRLGYSVSLPLSGKVVILLGFFGGMAYLSEWCRDSKIASGAKAALSRSAFWMGVFCFFMARIVSVL
jgi:hypothetical protein